MASVLRVLRTPHSALNGQVIRHDTTIILTKYKFLTNLTVTSHTVLECLGPVASAVMTFYNTSDLSPILVLSLE